MDAIFPGMFLTAPVFLICDNSGSLDQYIKSSFVSSSCYRHCSIASRKF
jgi:hypothetical protein